MVNSITCAELFQRHRRGLEDVGEPMTFGAALDQQTNASLGSKNVCVTVPDGKVFLMTHIVVQADDQSGRSAPESSPSENSFSGLRIGDPGNTRSLLGFKAWRRWLSIFDSVATPSWRNAPPSNAVVWKPRYPILVPPTWEAKTGGTLGELGNFGGCYGYLIDTAAAQALGFRCNPNTTIEREGVAGGIGTTSFSNILAGRTKRAIRIKDIHIRMQARTHTPNTLILRQSTGTREILRITCSNPSDLLEVVISPDIYLASGASLEHQTTVAGSCSVNVSYEFVNEEDIPPSHWWVSLQPTLPTPATGTRGLLETQTFANTAVTPYFPARNEATAVVPRGSQMIVNGYLVNLQKTDVPASAKAFIALSGGTSAGGIENGALGWQAPTDSVQISPVFIAGQHDTNLTVAVDDIDVPVRNDPDTREAGRLYVNMCGTSPDVISSTPSTVNTSAVSVCMWGKVGREQVRHLTNRGE